MMRSTTKIIQLGVWLLITVSAIAHPGADTIDYPGWMRDAIIYGIKPSSFVDKGSYDDITAKIPELKQLGINTIWLQPVFKTSRGGQGYDVTDYFSLRDDLGTGEQLKKLIVTAKANGIRILFDFVPNHTSVDHPYAIDCRQKGRASSYYDYYQHIDDGAPYSSFYHTDENGFVYYFWKDLVNLNFDNERVQQMIIDACKYWIKEYDIDGYRFDAVWAVNARAPAFGKRLRAELKSLKPDVLLLAEDKGSVAAVYDKGFDAAYDWTADTSWVSHWSWQYEYHEKKNLTVYNHPDVLQRKLLLRAALFSNQANGFRLLRFMENNDLPRFINSHSIEQTRMAAAILFSLPGIPLIFGGQEIGFKGHPYSRQPIFDAAKTIRQQDSLGLFAFYQSLIAKRADYKPLRESSLREIPVSAPSIIVYKNVNGREDVIVVANLDSVMSTLEIPRQFLRKGNRRYRDILTGKKVRLARAKGMQVQGYGALWLTPENVWREHLRQAGNTGVQQGQSRF